jgi:hypothetical protein
LFVLKQWAPVSTGAFFVEGTPVVMAGLGPAIHVFVSRNEDVAARLERGHDETQMILSLVFFKLRCN